MRHPRLSSLTLEQTLATKAPSRRTAQLSVVLIVGLVPRQKRLTHNRPGVKRAHILSSLVDNGTGMEREEKIHGVYTRGSY